MNISVGSGPLCTDKLGQHGHALASLPTCLNTCSWLLEPSARILVRRASLPAAQLPPARRFLYARRAGKVRLRESPTLRCTGLQSSRDAVRSLGQRQNFFNEIPTFSLHDDSSSDRCSRDSGSIAPSLTRSSLVCHVQHVADEPRIFQASRGSGSTNLPTSSGLRLASSE